MNDSQSDNASHILSLVIYNKPLYFHHNDICSLAIINKKNRKAIQDTALSRRNHLQALDPKGSIIALSDSPLTWHEYGSMCAARATTWYSNYHSTLELYCFTYNEHNEVSTMCSEDFAYHPKKEKSACQPFFNRVRIDDKGGVFFHDLSLQTDKRLLSNFNIIEFSCSKDQKSRKRACLIFIKDSQTNYTLSHLMPFPALLKAFLQAPIAKQDDTYKFYDLGGAIIPDNYQDIDKNYLYVGPFDKYLPEELKNAIIKRYEQQKSK